MEHKSVTAQMELKSLDEKGTFEGYASVYGIEDYDGDVIQKGAFLDAVKNAGEGKMPKMLWQHNPTIIVGKFTELREDANGLFVKGQLIQEVEKGKEAYTLMKAGVLDGMSVGFNISQASNRKGGGRDITKADLWEISIVTWGANPEALVSSVKCVDNKRDFERLLRDAGFSQKEAKRITAEGFEPKSDRDDSDLVESLTSITDNLRK